MTPCLAADKRVGCGEILLLLFVAEAVGSGESLSFCGSLSKIPRSILLERPIPNVFLSIATDASAYASEIGSLLTLFWEELLLDEGFTIPGGITSAGPGSPLDSASSSGSLPLPRPMSDAKA